MQLLPTPPSSPQNIQSPEPRVSTNGLALEVHSIFRTIQGEGIYSGVPCVFLRLAGCNLQCPGCDTEYTQGRVAIPLTGILERIGSLFPETPFERPRLVVVTGGEPMRQNIVPLTIALLDLGAMVQFETNGTYAPPIGFSSHPRLKVVCSPKAGSVAKGLLPFISAYKYVLQVGYVSPEDGLPTSILGKEIVPARPHFGFMGPVYISPMDDQDSSLNIENRLATVRTCLHFGYIFNLQLHKLLDLP